MKHASENAQLHTPSGRYRVFISYAREDSSVVGRLAKTLARAGLDPMWDSTLTPGARFLDEIQLLISHSQIVLALLTPASRTSPWFNQEVGYAVALGIPVVPVGIGTLPVGFIGDLQAISLAKDLRDAEHKLTVDLLEDRISRAPGRAVFECAVDNTRRAGLLADYAQSVMALKRSGLVRQKASLTTFHLPEREPRDPIWGHYFSGNPDDVMLFEQLQRERDALTALAVNDGCCLLVDPVEALPRVYRKHGIESVAFRVRGLLAFLQNKKVRNIRVAIGPDGHRHESLTIVGDLFSSEALSTGAEQVLRNAIFTRHAPTIHRQIRAFDQEFDERLRSVGWSTTSCRARAIEYYQAFLKGRPNTGLPVQQPPGQRLSTRQVRKNRPRLRGGLSGDE